MVDLPAPTPLHGLGPSQQPLSRPSGAASEKGSQTLGTSRATQLVRVAKELASEPAPVDHARVAQIKASISSGTYRTDPEAIASALLGNR